jgi:hypothetical protein
MKNTTKKPVETKVTKVKPMKTEKKQVEKIAEVKTENPVSKQLTIHSKIQKLEVAYMSALSGKMKFGKVKSMFKKLHKAIKKSAKKS